MTADERAAAGSIAVQLQRAARSVARAVQAADAGDAGTLTHLLNAELDVAGVAHRLVLLRRGVVVGTMTGVALEGGARHRERDAAGRFRKVSNPGAP